MTSWHWVSAGVSDGVEPCGLGLVGHGMLELYVTAPSIVAWARRYSHQNRQFGRKHVPYRLAGNPQTIFSLSDTTRHTVEVSDQADGAILAVSGGPSGLADWRIALVRGPLHLSTIAAGATLSIPPWLSHRAGPARPDLVHHRARQDWYHYRKGHLVLHSKRGKG